MTQRTAVVERSEYTPDAWNADQQAFHIASSLEDAMRKASCLAGGWYRRPVTIYMQIVGRHELYKMAPADAPKPQFFNRVYTIDAHAGER